MARLKSERLEVVLTLAVRREQQAARQLSDYRARLEKEKQQLLQLQRYYDDYIDRIEKQKHRVSVQEVITYREFSHRLAEAQRQQQHKLEHWQGQLDSLHKKWVIMHRRRETVAELIDRTRREEQRHRDGLEQKQLDEIAANIRKEPLNSAFDL